MNTIANIFISKLGVNKYLQVNNSEEIELFLKSLVDFAQEFNFDFSSLDANGFRVALYRLPIQDSYDYHIEKSVNSVKFRLNESGQLGVFHNWKKGAEFDPLIWKAWSCLNNAILETMYSKGA